MALTDIAIRNIKQGVNAKKYSDANGLFLLVQPSGSKLWRYAYRFQGKQKTLSLGSYPLVSLRDARTKRDEARELLIKEIDPGEKLKSDKLQRLIQSSITFTHVADEFLEKMECEGKALVTLTKKRWLLDMAKAGFGKKPIHEIKAPEILQTLKKVEAKGNYETARRLRSTISQVFRYGIATARTDNDPTFGLRGALIAPTVTHRAAITEKDKFAGLIRSIWDYDGNPETRIALKLMALLFPRPGELRQASWLEFDLNKGIWTMPAARMKMRREHKKHLSSLVVSLLEELKVFSGYTELAFPGIHSRHRPMSENTLNSALRRMGFTADEATSHGFRASASSLLNESNLWSADAIEAELAHVGADEVRRAYHRALYWDERVKLMNWWSDTVNELALQHPR